MRSGVYYVNVFVLFFLSALSLSSNANNLLLTPFFGGTEESPYSAAVLAVSEDENYIVFSSSEREIPGVPGFVNSDNRNLIYIKDVVNNEILPLSRTSDGESTRHIDSNSISGITANNNVYFKYSGNEPLMAHEGVDSLADIDTYLFRINLDSKIVTHVATPDISLNQDGFIATQNETLYFVNQNDRDLYISSDQGEQWQIVENQCDYGIELISYTSNAGVLYRCERSGIQPYKFYTPETDTKTIANGLFLDDNGRYYDSNNMDIASDASTILYGLSSAVYSYDLATQNLALFDLSHFNLHDIKVIATNDNGEQLFFHADIYNLIILSNDTPRIASNTDGLFFYDLSKPDLAPIRVDIRETHTNDEIVVASIPTSRQRFIDQTFDTFYVAEQLNTSSGISKSYKITTSEISQFQFHGSEDTPKLTVTSTAEHTNNVTIDQPIAAPYYKLLRHNAKTDKTDVMWLTFQDFEDFRFGLQPGENTYSVYECNHNLACAEHSEPSVSATTIDFPPIENFTSRIDGSRSSATISLNDFDVAENIAVRARTLHDGEDRFIASHSWNHFRLENPKEHASFAFQSCVVNYLSSEFRIEDGFVCSESTAFYNVTLPNYVQPVPLLATDHSHLTVYFSERADIIYNIQREDPDSDQFVTIAENISSGWQDHAIIAGNRYKYRILACDDSANICRTGQDFSYFVARKQELYFRASGSDETVRLQVYYNYDFDHISLYKSIAKQPYFEIAQLSDGESVFYDTETTPGIVYDYKAVAYKDNVVMQEDTDREGVSSRQSSDVYAHSPLSNLQIDTESYFYAHRLTWDEIPNASGYRVRIYRSMDFNYSESFELQGSNSNAFISPFEAYIEDSTHVYYSVEPIFENCNGTCIQIYGNPLISPRVELSIGIDSSKQIPTNEIYASQFNSQGIRISFSEQFIADNYTLYRKSSSDENWTLVNGAVQQPGYRNPYFEVMDFASNLTINTAYQYRLVTCSDLIQSCTTSETTEANELRAIDFTELPTAPGINMNLTHFEVTANVDSGNYIRFVELQALRENSESNWEIVNFDSSVFLTRSHNWRNGDVVEFRIRYCISEPGAHYTLENCTPYSEPTQVEIDDSDTVREPRLNASATAGSDIANTILINGEYSTNSSYDAPDYLELYRAADNGEFELIQTEHNIVPIVDRSGTSFSFYDDNLLSGNYYQYAVRGCNVTACYSNTTQTIYYGEVIQEVPAAPRISSVQSGIFTDRIVVHFSPALTASSHSLLRAETADGEFLTINSSSYSNSIYDYNLNPGDSFFYKIQACNESGCTDSDIVQAHTATLLYSEAISVTGADFYFFENNYSDVIDINGRVEAHHGYVDAFRGSINFNQWVDIQQGLQFTTNARLDADWSECSTLLEFKLSLPNVNGNSSSAYDSSLASLIYSGNGCEAHPEMELFDLYVISDYLSSPIKINSEITRETWQQYTVNVDIEGFIKILVGDELVASSDMQIPMDVFGVTQLKLEMSSDYLYSNNTYISSIDLTANTPENISEANILSLQSPSFRSIHATKIGLQFNAQNDALIEYRLIVDQQLSALVEMQTSTTNSYQGIIHDLSPNRSYKGLFRLCVQQICGPYEFVGVTTEKYEELRYTSILRASLEPQLQEGVAIINVDLYRNYETIIDEYIIYKSIEGSEESHSEFLRVTIDEVFDHYLQSDSGFQVQDTALLGEQINYSLELCNPIGCITGENVDSVFVPDDSDGDGVLDPYDSFPDDPAEDTDTDNDGIGNNADTDDDNDGIPDEVEIAAGMNPLYRHDLYDDVDGDGYNNKFEFLVGSEIGNPHSSPENYDGGIFTSFETATEEYVSISDNGSRVEYSGYDHYSIEKLFEGPDESDLRFSIVGKITGGYLVYSWNFTQSLTMKVYVNGQRVTVPESSIEYIDGTGFYWRTWAMPLEATDDLAIIEVTFNGYGESFPTQINVDRLYFPVESPVKLAKSKVLADYDGDKKTDFAIRYPSLEQFHVIQSSDDQATTVNFGKKAEDIPLVGDFDGDGKADLAFRRPSTQIWYVFNSSKTNYNSDRGDGIQRVTFGRDEKDIPVPADYDGDGITDFAVRRPGNAYWYIKNSSGNNYNSSRNDGIQRIRFGLQEADIPVPGDYDGDGYDDIAVRRPNNSTWYIKESSTGEIRRVVFGLQETDMPVPADYDGDGKTDLAFVRYSNQTWYILRSTDNTIERISLELSETDIPVAGDYDDDGKADVAFTNSSASQWTIHKSSNGEIRIVTNIQPGSDTRIPLLAPIWQQLSLLGWDDKFIFSNVSGE